MALALLNIMLVALPMAHCYPTVFQDLPLGSSTFIILLNTSACSDKRCNNTITSGTLSPQGTGLLSSSWRSGTGGVCPTRPTWPPWNRPPLGRWGRSPSRWEPTSFWPSAITSTTLALTVWTLLGLMSVDAFYLVFLHRKSTERVSDHMWIVFWV